MVRNLFFLNRSQSLVKGVAHNYASFPTNGIVIKTYMEVTNTMELLLLAADTADNSTFL